VSGDRDRASRLSFTATILRVTGMTGLKPTLKNEEGRRRFGRVRL
jgi:hypothetical protein